MPLDVILLSIYGISCATMELYKQVKYLFHDLKPPIPKVSSSKHRLYHPKLVDDIRSEANDHYGFLARLKHKLETVGRWSWAIEMTGRVMVVMAQVGALLARIHALPQQPVPWSPSYFSGANGNASASVGTSQWPPPVTSYSSGSRHVSSVSIPPPITRTKPPPTISSSRIRSFTHGTQTTLSNKSTQWSSSYLSGSNSLTSSSDILTTTTSQLSLPATSYGGRPSKCTSSSSTATRSRVRPNSTAPPSTNDRVARSSSRASRTSSHSDTTSFCSTRAYTHHSGISYRPTK